MTWGKAVSRPGWLVAVPASISFLVWVTPWPDSFRRGFNEREELSLEGIAFLLAWYGLLAVVAMVAWLAGRQTEPLENLDNADDARVYRILTWLGAAGVVGMYVLVELQSPGLVVQAVRERSFNAVREAVPMTAGVATLRYATIASGAIATHRLVVLRERRSVHWLNLGLLVGSVLVASRLSLVMSALLFVGLLVLRREGSLARHKKGLVLAVVLALMVLGYANYVRNANYYESVRGTRNPAAMLASEAVAYIGTPTQAAIGTANAGAWQFPALGAGDVTRGLEDLMLPSFLGDAPDGETNRRLNWYRGSVSVEASLSTNSALAAVYGLLGGWSFPAMTFVVALAGFLMGHLSRYSSYMALGSFVIGYCFAELWRISLFNEGIVWFLLIALLGACLIAGRSDPGVGRMAPRRPPAAHRRTGHHVA
ncbi:hypothetical protein [Nocardioides pakistanensis]